MADWIDNADSYICPVCRFECNNPNRYHGKCPKCGFIATKDVRSSDVVEVIRCKDCKYGMKSRLQPRHSKNYLCRHSWEGEYHESDHYCSYGERKDNDNRT